MNGRYAVFHGESYYPQGGWSDLSGQYETEEEAMNTIPKRLPNQWVQVVDLETGEMLLDKMGNMAGDGYLQ